MNSLIRIHPPKWLAFVLLAGMLAACDRLDRSEQQLYQEASVLAGHGDFNAAVIQLKNILSANNQHNDARTLLGRVYWQQGAFTLAAKELTRALKDGADLAQLADWLTDALILSGRQQQIFTLFAVDEADPAQLKGLKTTALAEASLYDGNTDQAAEYFELALGHDANNSRALTGLAMLKLLFGELDQAADHLEAAKALSTEDPRFWLTRADIQRASGDHSGVQDSLQQAASVSLNYSQYYYLLAMREQALAWLRQNRTAEAKEILAQLRQTVPERLLARDADSAHAMALVAFAERRYSDVTQICQDILTLRKNHPGALLLGAVNHAIEENFWQAEQLLQQFLLLHPGHRRARKILAYLQLKNQNPLDAMDTLNHLVENQTSPSAELLALTGLASINAGKAGMGSSLLTSAASERPDDARIGLALVNGLATEDKMDQALELLSAIDGDAATDQKVLLARIRLEVKNRDYEAALDSTERLMALLPGQARVMALRGALQSLLGRQAEAEKDFNAALAIDGTERLALKGLAQIDVHQGRLDRARQRYRRAIDTYPRALGLYQDLATLLTSTGEMARAIDLLEQAARLDSASIKTAVMLGRLYNRTGKPLRAVQTLAVTRLKQQANAALFTELGNAYRSIGKHRDALDAYTRLAELRPGSAIPDYLIATVHILAKDHAGANAALSESLRKQPDFVPALVAAAQLSIRDNRLEDARNQLGRLQQAQPHNRAGRLIEASLASKESDYDKAVDIYTELYRDEASYFLLQNLVHSLWKAERMSEAAELLDAVIKQQPDELYALQLRASLNLALEREAAAIADYKSILDLRRNHDVALARLFKLLRKERPREALVYGELLARQRPEDLELKRQLKAMRTAFTSDEASASAH